MLLCQELYIEFLKLEVHKVTKASRRRIRLEPLEQHSLFGAFPEK
jgi:hypothetical protein